jgi:gamma-glutamylcysteine synthetase
MQQLQQDVAALLQTDKSDFEDRVATEQDQLKAELEVGTFDNTEALIGLEYEFYGVDDDSGALRRVPRSLLELIRFEKELGLHNIELTSSPQSLNPHGLAAIKHEIQSAVQTAHAATSRVEQIRLVSDGFWVLPPASESAEEYLSDTTRVNGARFATNLNGSPRYHAMEHSQTYEPGCRIDVPNVTARYQTTVPAALTASIQPHYQIPIAAELPTYFRYAVRIAGPLVALAANSPLFPPSLYDDDATVDDVLHRGYREHRVFVYESMMNDPDRAPKVRLPRDIDTTAEAVDRLAQDPLIVPTACEENGRFDDSFRHLRHKHGSYWRWVRPVFEGATRAAANARLEFRPLPAQPTVRDSISLLATVAGLMEGLVAADHPVARLSWEQARENFYAAARNGLDADLQWITADGSETTATEKIYTDLFDHAQRGLERRQFDAETAAAYLHPLRRRADRQVTPASWKRDRLRRHGADGDSLEQAVVAAQQDYLKAQRERLIEGSFVDWPGV